MTDRVAKTVLLPCCLLLAGCENSLPGKPDPKDRPVPAVRVTAFEAIFSRNCAGCHGSDGKMGAAPPLNDPLFRAIVPVTELQMVLSRGRPGTSMPPFAHSSGGPLTAAQVQVLVNEIKGVPYKVEPIAGQPHGVKVTADPDGTAPKWGIPPAAATTVPPFLLPETPGDKERGAKLFVRACSECHGANGEGVQRDGKHHGKLNDPAFLALISDQEVRRLVITGRFDLKMPNYWQKTGRPDDFQPLTSAEIADIGALLGSWRKRP